MGTAKKVQITEQPSKNTYKKFSKLDGSHPFKKVVPGGYVDYPARTRKGGKVRYFNFGLAKEMGLIPKDHDMELNPELEQEILDTFAIIIVNEFDQMNSRSYPKNEMKSGTYMATRYLQLQHEDKKGRTSGDGRSVWNGQVKHKGAIWDVSSCGTGATCLSPATSKFGKFFESGDPSISYGCGYSEIDEGFAQALFSEVFHKNQIETERSLGVIEFEKGYSINIRAHKNLLRPSHFFSYLKQGKSEPLKALLDYHIEVEKQHDDWEKCPVGDKKYDFFLKHFAQTFGKIAATFENEYIFCWLDWDGDNILMNGGIIDYGSVRQFGMFHSEYRYDDVDRFSTSILEQRDKAKYIVQAFVQSVDLVLTGEKKGLSKFKNHPCLKEFDESFVLERNKHALFKIGFSEQESNYLIKNHLKLVKEYRKIFSYFERAKSSKGLVKINDGITWDAVFCMRDLLRDLPQILMARKGTLNDEEFIEILKSDYATEDDMKLTPYRKQMISAFQKKYLDIVEVVSKYNKQNREKQLLSISMRSSVINKMERVTGDSITFIVELMLKKRKKMTVGQLYELISEFSILQEVHPHKTPKLAPITKGLVKQFFKIVKEHREGI